MELCSKRFGYESPAVGAWAVALALQLSAGVMLVLVGYNNEELNYLLTVGNADSHYYKFLQWLGICHIIVSIGIGIIIALGLFVSSCFLLPLCVISLLQNSLCIGSSVVCGLVYSNWCRYVKSVQFHEPISGSPDPKDVLLVQHYGAYLIAAACLTLGSIAASGRASSMKNDTPIPEAQLYLPTGVLLVVNGALLAIGGGGESYTIPMACIWFAAAVGIAIVVGIANWCCTPKVFNAAVGAAFACVALFSFITCGMVTNSYKSVQTKYNYVDYLSSIRIAPPQPLPVDWKLFVMMGHGTYLIAVAAISIASGILATFSACYSLRSALFCFGKGDTA